MEATENGTESSSGIVRDGFILDFISGAKEVKDSPKGAQIFADTTWHGRRFNKLVVFDEAYKYIGSPALVAGLIEVVREMRHKGTSVMVASQDPPSVPTSLIELSTQIILHKFNSPAWLQTS